MANRVALLGFIVLVVIVGCRKQNQVELLAAQELEGSWNVVRMRMYPKPNFQNDSTWTPSASETLRLVFGKCTREDEKNRACQGYSDFRGYRHPFNYHVKDGSGNQTVFFPTAGQLSDRWGFNGTYQISGRTASGNTLMLSTDYNRFVAGGKE